MAKPVGFGGRDYPDFGVSDTYRRNAIISDMSELAVRLGAINWFDRVGTQLFADDFRYGISNWEDSSYPAAALPVLSARYYATYPYSVKLKTTTDVGSVSGITRGFPFPYLSIMGIEMQFKAISAFRLIYNELTLYTGTTSYYLGVKIDYANDQILVRSTGGSYVYVDDLNIFMGANSPFNIIKVVVDLPNERYVRLMINDRDYNISNLSLQEAASATKAYLYDIILLDCQDGRSETVWIDNVIFTIDEPSV